MSDDSVQKWLERNRPPRVKITYEVHTGGALERRELPFIVGVFADLSGDGAGSLLKFKHRQMLPIDRDNFDEVMRSQKPSALLANVPRTVPNLKGEEPQKNGAGDGPMLTGSVAFGQLEDFSPVRVVKAIPELHRLYMIRGQIRALQARSETSADLAEALDALLDPKASAGRDQLMVLARPEGVTAANIADAKRSLFVLGAKLALAAADADAKTAMDSWGITPLQTKKQDGTMTDDVPGTADSVRASLGIYGVPEAEWPDAQKLLTTLSKADPKKLQDADPALKPVIDTFQLVLANATDVTTQAAALVTELGKALPVLSDNPSDTDKTTLAAAKTRLARVQAAASLFAGLLKPDNESPLLPFVSGPTERDQTESNHDSANRYFATNLLLQLKGLPGGSAAPAPKSSPATKTTKPKPGGTTPAQPPAPATPWDRLRALEALMTKALPTDAAPLDRLGMLAAFGQFVLQVLKPMDAGSPTAKAVRAAYAIDQRVASIDAALSTQLSAVMHSDSFRQLEATWRGLHYLVSRTETGKLLKLRVFNASWQELLDDMDTAVEKDQSHLFKMIYEAEYGTLGGDPYSLLVGGYEFGRSAQEIEFLKKISEVAAAAHAPFITAAAPSLFGLSSFGNLARPRDLEKIFEGVDLAGWQEFRASEESRYVSMVLPHVLLRLPYGSESWPVAGLHFEEDVGVAEHNRFLWGNAAYMLAERITHAFALYSWTAAIRGVEGGGLVAGLPLYAYDTGNGTRELFCPTEVSITDRREKELNDLGFISLCHCKGMGQAAFFGGQTANLPKKYITDEANANAKLSALLPYMLAASRFAHYIKVIMRDKVGSFMTRGNVEAFLNTWITQYVLLDENAMQEAKSAFPLSQANIVVKDVPGDVGNYNAIVFLRPHFQLEELSTSIRLVAKVPA